MDGRRLLGVCALAVAVVTAACGRSSPAGDPARPTPTSAQANGGPASATSPPPAASPSTSTGPKALRALVWVAAERADRIVEVDLASKRIAATVAAAGGPHNLTVAPDGTVVTALYGSDRIELVRRGRASTVRLGGRPHDVKVAGDLVVVANEGAARLDLLTLEGRPAGSVALKTDPHDIAVEPGGARVWASLDRSGDLAVVTLRTRSVRYLPSGGRPHDLLFARDGRLFVTDWNGTLRVYSPQGRAVASIPLGVEAHHLALTPDGRQVWVTDNKLQRVFVVDARTPAKMAAIAVAGAPHHVAITPDGKLAAVADNSHGTLLVFDVASRRLVATVPVGAGPHGVWAA